VDCFRILQNCCQVRNLPCYKLKSDGLELGSHLPNVFDQLFKIYLSVDVRIEVMLEECMCKCTE
jgi:hypothetical protein